MALPVNFWILFGICMLVSSIGFKNYVWFISLGYGFSIAAEGLAMLLLYGKALTPGTIVCCLIFTGFCFAFVAQVKTKNGFWWRNMVFVRLVFLFMRSAEKFRSWMTETGRARLSRFVKKLWQRIWKMLVRLYEAIEKITSHTVSLGTFRAPSYTAVYLR